MNDNRIEAARNRVFQSDIGIGKNNPISLHTSPTCVYRITGLDQIVDIINCGYIRPKAGRIKGGHVNEVFWSMGGEKTFYYDKRPVLEVPSSKVSDSQIGSLPLESLSSIWIFDSKRNAYVDKLGVIIHIRNACRQAGRVITVEEISRLLNEEDTLMSLSGEYFSNEDTSSKSR